MNDSISLLLSAALLLFSCSGGKTTEDAENTAAQPSAEATAEAPDSEPQPKLEQGMVTRQGAYLLAQPEGKLVKKLDFGIRLSWNPNEDQVAGKTNYHYVSTDTGDSGYLVWYYAAANAQPHIVERDSPLLNGFNPYAYNDRGEVLHRGALIGVMQVFNGVAKISYSDMDSNYAKMDRYVAENDLELIFSSDLELYQGYYTAYQLANKDSQKQLIEAILPFAGEMLASELESMLYSITAERPLPEAYTAGARVLASEDNLSLRDQPSASGEKLEQLAKGSELEIVGHSDSGERIGNNYNYWYQVKVVTNENLGKEGWIYGAFVAPKPSRAEESQNPDQSTPEPPKKI